MADILRQAGHDAHPVFTFPDQTYPYFRSDAQPFFDPALKVLDRNAGRRRRLRQIQQDIRRLVSPGRIRHPVLARRSDDVVVIPEYWYPEFASAYPDHRKVCLVQVVLNFAYAMVRLGNDARLAPEAYISTSKVCGDAVRVFARQEATEVVLQVGTGKTTFVAEKKKKIAYMPRKLPDQARAIVKTLRSSSEAEGYEFISLSGLTHDNVMVELRGSLFFLTFSKAEGFGLPPAEAMASGCIVIGYTGVGGNEFFTADTGFPIESDDVTDFVGVVRSVLKSYVKDPDRLDTMRQRASERILGKYTAERFHKTTLRAFEQVANYNSSS